MGLDGSLSLEEFSGMCGQDAVNIRHRGWKRVGIKRLEHPFFGSVAENVVKKSPAPVLTMNPYKVKLLPIQKAAE